VLRIAYITATLDTGGAETQLVRLILGLDRGRFEPALCCLTRTGEIAGELEARGIPVHLIGKRGKVDVRALWRLVGLLKRLRPHIVHTQLFTANSYGRAAGILAGVPHLIASELSVDPWKGAWHRAIDRLLAVRSDAVVANAEAVRAACVARGIPARKIRVIRNGIEVSRYSTACDREYRRELGIPSRSPVVGFVGRLVPEKGVEDLISAARLVRNEIPRAIFLIGGEGPDRERLERLAAGEPNIRFLGRVGEIERFYAALDVFVLPSLWEGLPLVVLEAMASATPVVATDVGGTAEAVRNGECGFIVPARSWRPLAEAIVKLLRSSTLRKEMGTRGREVVSREYECARMVEEFSRLYEEAFCFDLRGDLG